MAVTQPQASTVDPQPSTSTGRSHLSTSFFRPTSPYVDSDDDGYDSQNPPPSNAVARNLSIDSFKSLISTCLEDEVQLPALFL